MVKAIARIWFEQLEMRTRREFLDGIVISRRIWSKVNVPLHNGGLRRRKAKTEEQKRDKTQQSLHIPFPPMKVVNLVPQIVSEILSKSYGWDGARRSIHTSRAWKARFKTQMITPAVVRTVAEMFGYTSLSR